MLQIPSHFQDTCGICQEHLDPGGIAQNVIVIMSRRLEKFKSLKGPHKYNTFLIKSNLNLINLMLCFLLVSY